MAKKDTKAPVKALSSEPIFYGKNSKGEWTQKTAKKKRKSGK